MQSKPESVSDIFLPVCQYVIPIFQRHYVWSKEDQWEPLWEDLLSQVRVRLDGRVPKPHYCGAIVIDEKRRTNISEPNRFNVIDGQQRLTTFQIMLSAMRDVCIKQEAISSAQKIGKLIFNAAEYNDANDIQNHVKLRPTKFDRASFFDVLATADREKLRQKYHTVFKAKAPRKGVEKLVEIPNSVGAYIFFYDSISRAVTHPEEFFGTDSYTSQEVLDALSHGLTEDFHTVVILLDQTDDAQVIFESLNYRGQPLLAADLIRNYAFMRAEQNKEDVNDIYETDWAKFEDRFWTSEERQGRIKKQRIEFFFANFLVANTGSEINQSRVYQEYLSWITDTKHDLRVKQEIKYIVQYANVYRELVEPRGNSELEGFSKFLSAFDITIAFPLIMAVFTDGNLDKLERAQILLDFESYIVRRSICGRTPKGYNKLIIQAIKELKSKRQGARTFQQFLLSSKAESADWPDDEQFEAAFIRKPLYRNLPSSRLLYILKRLEAAQLSRFSEEVKINADLNIEHVMPQTWFGIWPLGNGSHVTPDQVEQARKLDMLGLPLDAKQKQLLLRDNLVDTIGNLTLIVGKLNSSIGNSLFERKRNAILEHSALRLNRYFHHHIEWDESAISLRSSSLYKEALGVWPRPSS
jgi:uncharacterized protein with ParB-like and HNH nuclease domain